MYNNETRLQDKSLAISRGMNNFATWYRPEGRENYGKRRPSDVDGILHQGNRIQAWLMFEIKPRGKELSLGQMIRLRDFSLLPGCISICIWEPSWTDKDGYSYGDNIQIEIESFRNGQSMGIKKTTIGALNRRIAEWFDTKGRLTY